jgi:hypothetical protein
VITRIEEGHVLLDARTVLPDQDEQLLAMVHLALRDAPVSSATN